MHLAVFARTLELDLTARIIGMLDTRNKEEAVHDLQILGEVPSNHHWLVLWLGLPQEGMVVTDIILKIRHYSHQFPFVDWVQFKQETAGWHHQ